MKLLVIPDEILCLSKAEKQGILDLIAERVGRSVPINVIEITPSESRVGHISEAIKVSLCKLEGILKKI